MRASREGVVLPVVLVSLFLLASMVLTFQFLSSSDYKQVGKMVRTIQATALADLAADEVSLDIDAGQKAAAASGTQPPWMKPLLDALDGKVSGGGGGATGVLDVKQDIPFDDKIPVTKAAAEKTNGLVEISGIKAVAGPFTVRSTAYPANVMYAPADLGDGGKNRLAWDLRGPLNVEVSIKTSKGPLDFSQKYLRGQELQITDTTPPASEFALFGYMPPVTADYALNDLQRGGSFTVEPKLVGRVFLRGPLFLFPEEALASKLQMGGPTPPASTSYPFKKWLFMGNIPGPRTLQQVVKLSDNPFDQLIAQAKALAPAVKSDMSACRPEKEESHSVLKTNVIPIHVEVELPWPIGKKKVDEDVPAQDRDLGNVSMVIADKLDTDKPEFLTIDEDNLAFFPPGAYLHGPIAADKQHFRLKPPDILLYKGIVVPAAPDKPARIYVPGALAMEEGDSLAMEPLPNPAGAGDLGVVGVYGTASLESYTYGLLTAGDLSLYLVTLGAKKAVDKLSFPGWIKNKIWDAVQDQLGSINAQVMAQLKIRPDLKVLFRRFEVKTAAQNWESGPPKDLTAGGAPGEIQAKEAVLAPYGYFFHKEGVWNSVPVADDLHKTMLDAVKTPLITGKTAAQFCALFVNNPNSRTEADALITGGPPESGKAAKEFLRGDYEKRLLARTKAKDAASPEDAARVLVQGIEAGGQPRGLAPLAASVSKRPKGVLGDYWGPPPAAPDDMAALARDYPNGFYPPQFRDWERSATRSYETMKAYLDA
ncbi:MAG: hypothetical protein HY303_18415 [Candidatus Wallbacteria bacterium]|nr:hypothetical protein [Candidatus Wallbacteria bacterium]